MATKLCVLSRWALLVAAVYFTPLAGRAALYVSIEAPGVQATTVPSFYAARGQTVTVNTETFNELPLGIQTSFSFNGDSTIGTYTSPGIAILQANEYGGANNSDYAAVGAESGTTIATLTLNKLQGYFGMWWSAGDPYNELKFYNGSTLVADYTTANVITFLKATGEYSSYLGNPNDGFQDPDEPFAYLNFFATDSSELFNKVVIQNNSSYTGFESDNQSIAEGLLSGPFPGQQVSTIPEPSTIIIWLLLGAVALGQGWWRKAA